MGPFSTLFQSVEFHSGKPTVSFSGSKPCCGSPVPSKKPLLLRTGTQSLCHSVLPPHLLWNLQEPNCSFPAISTFLDDGGFSLPEMLLLTLTPIRTQLGTCFTRKPSLKLQSGFSCPFSVLRHNLGLFLTRYYHTYVS